MKSILFFVIAMLSCIVNVSNASRPTLYITRPAFVPMQRVNWSEVRQVLREQEAAERSKKIWQDIAEQEELQVQELRERSRKMVQEQMEKAFLGRELMQKGVNLLNKKRKEECIVQENKVRG